ncbi:MAG: elongation factor Ts [Porticoccaceae bacterium]|nr:MAG: elongation factor Ts [Porticoccaceae bacterium]
MAVTASQVKELRERTGLGMMECKKALEAAGGDIEKAIEELRKSSGLKAAKKAGRTAAEGVVALKVADDASYGVLVEVNCETDFVARDENFRAFVERVLDAAFARRGGEVAELMAGELEAARQALVQKVGENVAVRRAAVLEGQRVGGYLHSNHRIAVLVALSGGSEELARDLAMHVAAANPRVVRPADMPAEVVDKEREIYAAQAAESGKPAEIVAKMVEGRVRKFLSENSLLEQPFVRDPEVTVGRLAADAGVEVLGFVRFEVGEGIEVARPDFAAEVAAQVEGAR